MTTQKSTANVPQVIDGKVSALLATSNLNGFVRAHQLAVAVKEIKLLLTPDFMSPIMELQGSKLGFRTDRDRKKDGTKGDGYPMEVVKDCLIDATLMGLEPYNNQFNIIGGNMYPTVEGVSYLLKKFPGLWFEITPELPRVNNDRTSMAVKVLIRWSLDGAPVQERNPEYAITMATYTTIDAGIGKAKRKARKWLLETITGCTITEAPETLDVKHDVVKSNLDTTSKNMTDTLKGKAKVEPAATTEVKKDDTTMNEELV